MTATTVVSEILRTVDFAGRFDRVLNIELHGDGLLRLDVWLEKSEGVALLDLETGEIVAVRSVKEHSRQDRHGDADVWFQLDDGLAMLTGNEVLVWPDAAGESVTAFPIANPDHFAADPMVLADNFARRPSVLHIEPVRNGSATVLWSDNFYKRGGRYLATLTFRDGAFHWSGSYRQMEEADMGGEWTDRAFNLSETPLIHRIHEEGNHVACVTRGGTATMLNHGPAFQTNLVVRFRTPPVTEQPRPRFGLRSLFARKPETAEAPAFVFQDVVARPEGTILFDRQTGRHGVKLHKTNKLEFFEASDEQPLATLSLTPKRNLGSFKHGQVGLAIRDDLLVVCGQERLNICRMG